MGGCPESLTCYTQAPAQTLDCSRERGSLQLGSVLARVRTGLPSLSAPACNGDGGWHGLGHGSAWGRREWLNSSGPGSPQLQGTRHSPLGLLNSWLLLHQNT